MFTSQHDEQVARTARIQSQIKQRTCIGCREVTDQHNLTRVVNVDGVVVIDEMLTHGGRGAWLHPRSTCIATARAKSQFARAFRGQVELGETFLQWQHNIVRLEGVEPTRNNPNESG